MEANLDSNEAACFTKIFSFRKESCLADVEEKIRVKIVEILGTDNSDAIDFCLNENPQSPSYAGENGILSV